MNLNIKGKTAIIGGSSKGLGKACAVALAREGVNVVLLARDKEPLLRTKKEIEALGVEVLALSGDMTSEKDNRRFIDETIHKFGRIDILVNNSGGPKPGTFRDISDDDLDDAYHSVLKYNIRMTRGCLPHMEKNGWGRIINITSITVKEPAPNMVLSNIFRAAVVSFAKTISKELIGKGITINNVAPGYFKTDRVTQLMKVRSEVEGISMKEYELKAIQDFPNKRYMDPQELGDLVCYLCSENAKSITGTTIQVDGGLISGIL
ncbi:MAG: SDR family oxidoreductase [Dysgonamonadaceae bacterium]|nr:SDR family oxidoreductase [Dysgonamonadaceae bacterium]